MKKYLYFVIPIIILIAIIITFTVVYLNKKTNDTSVINADVNKIQEDESEYTNEVSSNSITQIDNNKDNEVQKPEDDNEENTEEITVKQEDKSSSEDNTTTKKESSTSTVKKDETNTAKKENKKDENKNTTSTQKTEQTQTTSKKDTTDTNNKQEEVKKEETVIRCTNNDNHGMSVGNTGKWFNSKDEAVAYYKSEVKRWGEWWEDTDADDTEADEIYRKNCPSGHQEWTCMYCRKWTIDFYYR